MRFRLGKLSSARALIYDIVGAALRVVWRESGSSLRRALSLTTGFWRSPGFGISLSTGRLGLFTRLLLLVERMLTELGRYYMLHIGPTCLWASEGRCAARSRLAEIPRVIIRIHSHRPELIRFRCLLFLSGSSVPAPCGCLYLGG